MRRKYSIFLMVRLCKTMKEKKRSRPKFRVKKKRRMMQYFQKLNRTLAKKSGKERSDLKGKKKILLAVVLVLVMAVGITSIVVIRNRNKTVV